MNDSGSIVEFFYNIVPGSLFLFLLKYYGIFDLAYLEYDPTSLILLTLVLGLFLGFLFQGITVFVRKRLRWNDKVFSIIKRRNIKEFEIITLNLKGRYQKSHNIPDETAFYLMDSSLRGDKAAFLPTHFSSRFAFWSNNLCAVLAVIIIGNFFHKLYCIDNIALISILGVSLWLAEHHLEGFYDSILKTYFMRLPQVD